MGSLDIAGRRVGDEELIAKEKPGLAAGLSSFRASEQGSRPHRSLNILGILDLHAERTAFHIHA